MTMANSELHLLDFDEDELETATNCSEMSCFELLVDGSDEEATIACEGEANNCDDASESNSDDASESDSDGSEEWEPEGNDEIENQWDRSWTIAGWRREIGFALRQGTGREGMTVTDDVAVFVRTPKSRCILDDSHDNFGLRRSKSLPDLGKNVYANSEEGADLLTEGVMRRTAELLNFSQVKLLQRKQAIMRDDTLSSSVKRQLTGQAAKDFTLLSARTVEVLECSMTLVPPSRKRHTITLSFNDRRTSSTRVFGA